MEEAMAPKDLHTYDTDGTFMWPMAYESEAHDTNGINSLFYLVNQVIAFVWNYSCGSQKTTGLKNSGKRLLWVPKNSESESEARVDKDSPDLSISIWKYIVSAITSWTFIEDSTGILKGVYEQKALQSADILNVIQNHGYVEDFISCCSLIDSHRSRCRSHIKNTRASVSNEIKLKYMDRNRLRDALDPQRQSDRFVDNFLKRSLGHRKLAEVMFALGVPELLKSNNWKVIQVLSHRSAKKTDIQWLVNDFLRWWGQALQNIVSHRSAPHGFNACMTALPWSWTTNESRKIKQAVRLRQAIAKGYLHFQELSSQQQEIVLKHDTKAKSGQRRHEQEQFQPHKIAICYGPHLLQSATISSSQELV